jgi:hypothetical protein
VLVTKTMGSERAGESPLTSATIGEALSYDQVVAALVRWAKGGVAVTAGIRMSHCPARAYATGGRSESSTVHPHPPCLQIETRIR